MKEEITEEWKPLTYKGIDLTDRYLISNTGKIFSIKSNKELKQNLINKYLGCVISLGKRGKYLSIKIHKAVAENFVPGKKDGLIINHKDGNKLNNYYKNLEWVTYSQNTKHAFDNGLIISTYAKRIKCNNNGMIFNSIKEAAEWCGVARGSINDYLNRNNNRITAGKHPKTGEGLTWSFVDEI